MWQNPVDACLQVEGYLNNYSMWKVIRQSRMIFRRLAVGAAQCRLSTLFCGFMACMHFIHIFVGIKCRTVIEVKINK